MRIISSYSDYYDISMSLGIDLTKVFVRELFRGPTFPLPNWNNTFSYFTKEKYPRFIKFYMGRKTENCLSYFYILVAGKLYGGFIAHKKDINEKIHNTIIWNKEDLDKWQDQYSIFDKRDASKTSYKYALEVLKIKGDNVLLNWAIENKIVIAVCSDNTQNKTTKIKYCEVNPILKDYSFQRILDSFTCYQELDMFIGNLATNEVIPEMSDKDKIVSHGFDLKQSFRKCKETK